MSDDHLGEAQVQRGLLLMEQRRYADAAGFFRQALAQSPHDAQAFRNLALCQLELPEEKRQALETVQRALECEPNESANHAVRACILSHLNRDREALVSAREAVGLDPYSLQARRMETQALLGLERWAEAEAAARRALFLDADDQTAANQLANALRLQNKMVENADRVAWLLERDPEDAITHATAGWAALQRGERRVAEEHFLQALRLQPELEYARSGLLESFRARSPVYRAYLAYSFRMAQLSRKGRWMVILGLYFGVKFARLLFTGPYAPIAKALGLVYLVFVLWVWIARGLGNFILLFDRFAKHALRRREKWEAVFVGGGVCAAVLLVGASVPMHSPVLLLAGCSCLAAAVPFAITFTNDSKIGPWLFGGIGATCLLAAVTIVVSAFFPNVLAEKTAMDIFSCGLIGAVATTWIGNIPALRR